MKFKLQAGADVDLLSPAEYREGAEHIGGRIDALGDIIERLDHPPILVRVEQTLTTDGAGNLGGGANSPQPGVLYRAPEGMTARIVRLTIATAASTPIAPVNTGWLAGYVDSVSPSQLAFASPQLGSTNVAPAVMTDGSQSATMIRNGQQLVVVGAALPATTIFGFGLQVWLYPNTGRFE